MTDQQYSNIMAALGVLVKGTAPAQWDNFLVASGQVQPIRPTKGETSANPGQYYKTADDPLAGPAPNIHVVLTFETKKQDEEGNEIHPFIGGSLLAWARADLPAFLAWYRQNTGFDLNLSKLHPEQRALMGL